MIRYASLRPLNEPSLREFERAFERLGELLEKSGERGRLQFQIRSAEARRYWSFELAAEGCRLRAEPVEKPDVEIITQAETWWQIADGTLSPVEAFGRGKMRIRGDLELAKRLYKKLATGEGSTEIC